MHAAIFGRAISTAYFTILPKLAINPILLIGSVNISMLNSNPFSALITYTSPSGNQTTVSTLGLKKLRVMIF